MRSKLALFYLIFGVGTTALYGLMNTMGWELGTPERDTIPASARNSPGGYRSFHFWHAGFQGGK